MTEEELDKARATEALRLWPGLAISIGVKPARDIAEEAARLAREGWEPVDPDWDEAEGLRRRWGSTSSRDLILAAIKRGRELERGLGRNPPPTPGDKWMAE